MMMKMAWEDSELDARVRFKEFPNRQNMKG